MSTLKKKLPGLNGIITFEAAARHLSFTEAAVELCVSQTAVSRQIRRLEEQIGVRLFVREHRCLHLTSAGRKFHRAVTLGLEHMANAAEEISRSHSDSQIQVATTVAFATYWLMPRLHAFRDRFANVDVRVLASDRYADQFSEEADIILACGDQHSPGQEIHFLFSEMIFPVCAPAYLKSRYLKKPADLLSEKLLHLDPRHWDDIGWEPVDWTVWLAQFGVDYDPKHPILTFNNYPMLVQAAIDGQGIALGWLHLVEGLLADGKLVRPIAEVWDSQRGYYLVMPATFTASEEVVALKNWLLASPGDEEERL